jgi:glucose-6-phosphate dehydrogenase assembly protein OpcA
VSGRRGDAVRVLGGQVEGDPGHATALLLAGWLSARCGCEIPVVASERRPGPSGVSAVVLELDQDEQVRVEADRRGGALITQPYRPEATVALPDRQLGDLVGEELRRLDPDEPFAEALESTTGIADLAHRSAVREHVWFDPAEAGRDGGEPLDTVPEDSVGSDEVAVNSERNSAEVAP